MTTASATERDFENPYEFSTNRLGDPNPQRPVMTTQSLDLIVLDELLKIDHFAKEQVLRTTSAALHERSRLRTFRTVSLGLSTLIAGAAFTCAVLSDCVGVPSAFLLSIAFPALGVAVASGIALSRGDAYDF
jgi:hypothetical protein